MKLSILGTGNMASGLAAALVGAGHEVAVGGRDPAKAAALAAKIGAGAVGGGLAAAAALADVIVLALPYGALAETLAGVGDLTGKILIDISNPISADFRELVIGHTTSAAEEVQKLVPQARVVKAFNTVFAQLLPPEARKGSPVQVFVASDDAAAKTRVSELAATLGFAPIDAGPLSNARFLEPVGEMNIHFGYFLGQGPVVAPAWVQA